jgi:sugar phosphate isomerase/epimerase
MRVGIFHPQAFPDVGDDDGATFDSLEQIALDPYFDAIEVGRFGGSDLRARAREMFEAAGVTVAYTAAPAVLGKKLNLNALDEGVRKSAVAFLKEELDIAAELGAVGMSLLSGPDPGSDDRSAAVDQLVISLVELCAYADEVDVPLIMLETFDRDVEKRALVGPNALGVHVSIRVRERQPNFGLLLDLSHIPLQHERPPDALRAARDHLFHAHIGNCILKDTGHLAYGDQHPHFGVTGGENGVEEVAEFLRCLFEIGYLSDGVRPIVSFEIKPQPQETSDLIIANAKRTLNAAWGLV